MKLPSRSRNFGITGSFLLIFSMSTWAGEDLGARADAYDLMRERESRPEFDVSRGCQGDQLQKIIAKMEDDWADGEKSVSAGLFSDVNECLIFEYEPSEVTSSSGGSRSLRTFMASASVTLTPLSIPRLGITICETAKANSGNDNTRFNQQIDEQIELLGKHLQTLSSSICTLEYANIKNGKLKQIVFSGGLLETALEDNHQPLDGVIDPNAEHLTTYRSWLRRELYIDPVLLFGERNNPGAARILSLAEIFNPETIALPLASNPAPKVEPNLNYEPDVVPDSKGRTRY